MGIKQKRCVDLVAENWESRKEDFTRFMTNYDNDEIQREYNEYGLGWDYVEPNTFDDQKIGYHRYQLSWGGPSDEIRFHDTGKVEYWYLDWFDGACVDVTDEDVIQWLKR